MVGDEDDGDIEPRRDTRPPPPHHTQPAALKIS